MARALRLAFPGSLWHLTTRGNERRDIVLDDADRRTLLCLIGAAVDRFRWIVHQYVLMSNHYHLVVELTDETLSSGMRWLNSRYAQTFNRRHGRIGHLFQGRFHGRLVEKDAYLLEVIRYVALNPVRARMVARPEDYRWSGHRALAGLCEAPEWLAVDRTLQCFAPDASIARTFYRHFVAEGIGRDRSPWNDVVGQIYLGTSGWVESLRARVEAKPRSDVHPVAQKKPAMRTMADVVAAVAESLAVSENVIRLGRGGEERMLVAWVGNRIESFDLRSIAAALRLNSAGGVSKMIRVCEARLRGDRQLQACVDRCVSILRRV